MFSQYEESLIAYTTSFLLLAIPAIIFGFAINYFIKYLEYHYNFSKTTLFIINLMLSIFLLFIIEFYISPQYAKRWQTLNPGFVFVTFYYAMQTELLSNIESIANNMISW